jgi:hypothetical protein
MNSGFSHDQLDVYRVFLEFACLSGEIVARRRDGLVVLDHLDRATESIGTNLLRANSQRPDSPLRAALLDVAIASTHECAACFDVGLARGAMERGEHVAGMQKLWRTRGMLLGLKASAVDRVRESEPDYGTPRFPHAELDVYAVALEAVRWVHVLTQEATVPGRARKKLDTSTTGTVLNVAEGHGRATSTDRLRFLRVASDHAFQTVLALDLMVARHEVTDARIMAGKELEARVISMLHAWARKLGGSWKRNSGDEYGDDYG